MPSSLFNFVKGTGTETASLAPYLDLKRVTSDSIHFTWNTQGLEDLNVTQIQVIFTSDSHPGIYGHATAHVSTGKLTVDELEPHTLYDVTVEATGNGVHIVHPIGLIRTQSSGKLNQGCAHDQPVASLLRHSQSTHVHVHPRQIY